ncbi:MAG: hypothetical protein R6U85_11590 [Salinivirgaceae bacterium]
MFSQAVEGVEGLVMKEVVYDSYYFNPDREIAFFGNCFSERECITQLFGDTVSFVAIGDKIVVLTNFSSRVEEPFVEYPVCGMIVDSETNSGIGSVSVMHVDEQYVVSTDAGGGFVLPRTTRFESGTLYIAKKGFEDTIVHFHPQLRDNLVILLRRKVFCDTLSANNRQRGVVDIIPKKISAGLLNRSITIAENLESISLCKFAQFSVLPFFNTNGDESPVVRNYLSVNLLGGLNGQVSGFEVSGVASLLNRGMRGFQMAGGMNFVNDEVVGFQCAGLGNFSFEGLHGAQISGGINYSAKKNIGIQIGGGSNIVRGALIGLQVGVIYNHCCGGVKGAQLSGLMNTSVEVLNGLQVGLVNYSGVNRGVQLGLVNIADTIDGAALGLFNYAKNGFYSLFVNSDNLLFFNVGFKTGSRKLYTMYNLSSSYFNHPVYGFGVGVGRLFQMHEKWHMATELTGRFLWEDLSESWLKYNVLRLSSTLSYEVLPNLLLGVGPQLNIMKFSNQTSMNESKFFMPFSSWQFSHNKLVLCIPGLHFGVDFLF